MAIKVKGGSAGIDLADGLHTGKIISIEERSVEGKDYAYLDVFIEPSESPGNEVKVGFALPKSGKGVSPKTDLGKLLFRFLGKDVVRDEEYDLEQIFISKPVQFMSLLNKEKFVDVMKESLRPKT